MLKIYQLRKPQNTFEVTLKYKGVGVRVAFVDGNNYRDIPAKCYTRDPFKQRAIENSQMFKDREIVLDKTIAEPGDNEPAKPATKPTEAAAPEPAPAPTPVDNGMQAMEFQNLAEAIQYIATTWQIGVQTESEARNVLREHGINPKIKRG